MFGQQDDSRYPGRIVIGPIVDRVTVNRAAHPDMIVVPGENNHFIFFTFARNHRHHVRHFLFGDLMGCFYQKD